MKKKRRVKRAPNDTIEIRQTFEHCLSSLLAGRFEVT